MTRLPRRPSAHFTPRQGWLNDPYGVHWDGERYHLYYQAIPDRTVWAPNCSWGHAVSPDLVTWDEQPLALVPQSFETGCWSGCVIPDGAAGSGAARAFYTRVQSPDLDLGSVALARFDGRGALTSHADDVVVRPPEGMAVTAFRDPYVWSDGSGWTMIVGGGTADGAGAVFRYRSEDLEQWRFTGVLCSGRVGTEHGAARQVWECPQLVELDGTSLLVVSLQLDGGAGPIVATLDASGGDAGAERRWQRLVFGSAPYATSLFRDRDGRPCMMTWLREDEQHDPAAQVWAGAESLVAQLRVDPSGTVLAEPYRALDGDGTFTEVAPAGQSWTHDLDTGHATRATASGGEPLDLRVLSGGRQVASVRTGADGSVAIERTGRTTDVVPSPEASLGVDVFLDADILEVFAGGSYGAWRL